MSILQNSSCPAEGTYYFSHGSPITPTQFQPTSAYSVPKPKPKAIQQAEPPGALDLHVAKLLALADPTSPSKGDVGPLVLAGREGTGFRTVGYDF